MNLYLQSIIYLRGHDARRDIFNSLRCFNLRNKFLYFCCFLIVSMLPIHNCLAESINDLENITIQVIGLDEIPDSSIEIIPLPEPDLGEISHTNRDISRNSNSPTPTGADLLEIDTVVGGSEPPPTSGTGGSAPQ